MLTSNELRAHLERALGGSYRVLEELTGGGMSRVFTAEDISLGRKIVIKVLSPELAASVNLERFKREIQVAAGLQHANIVPVLAAGDADGLPYYTMPYVTGRSVRDSIASGSGLPMRDVLTVLRDLARALAYAHERGVVHRDIKPDNVLWAGGAAAVTDFGIAKAISAARTHAVRPDLREPLTTAGMSLGTPAYMAPEQISADPAADHRTDIYSFGVTAYELITGRTPFAGRSQQAVLTAHLTEKPRHVASAGVNVPRTLADLVMQCLEKDPARRPQTAGEMLDTLGGVTTGERSLRAPRVGARAMGLAIAAALALVVGAVAFWRGGGAGRPAGRADLVAVLPFRVASADPGLRYLREGMIDLLASKLTGEGGLRVLEPRVVLDPWRGAGGSESRDLPMGRSLEVAQVLGAGRLLLGDVVGTPTAIVLSAALVSVPRGDSIARVTVEGPADSLAVLVDRLARDLLLRTQGEAARLPMLAGTNLPALRAYLDGQARLRRSEVAAAAEAFERALSHDSTMALAGLGLSMATSWFGDPQRGNRGLQIAWRERQRLSQRDQLMVEAIAGPHFPEPSSTREIYDARLRYWQQAQDRADAWYLLGDDIFHWGRTLDLPDPLREALRHFTRAAEIDSTYVVGYIHGVELAMALGDSALSHRFRRMRAAADTSTDDFWFYEWLDAHAARDTARLNALWRDSSDNLVRYTQIGRVALLTGFGASDALRAARYVADHSQGFGNASMPAYLWALAAGQSRLADEFLRRAYPDSGGRTPLNRLVLQVRAYNVGLGSEADARSAAAAMAQLDAGPLSADSIVRSEQRAATRVLEIWRLLRGDSSHTARSLARLSAYAAAAQADLQDARLEIALISALRESLRGRAGPAPHLESLDSLLRNLDWSRIHHGRMTEASIIAGRLFAARGDYRRAAQAAGRRVQWNDFVHPYVTTQLRDEGRYLAQAGEPERAARAWEQYLRLRHSPDDVYRAEVEEIRRALASLRRR